MTTTNEKDDTARLVLMDMDKHHGFIDFARRMREELPGMTSLDLQYYYRKYRGLDRQPPTHNVETGARL
jgi:hypothetical protein